MRYYVTVEGRTLEVDLAGDTPRVDGQPVSAECAEAARRIRDFAVTLKK